MVVKIMTNQKLFCKNGGCSAKLGPKALDHVLSKLVRKHDEHLLVGYDNKDDAAVYQISDDMAIVSTLDFFPAMVEDPYMFGAIAAANALSDIYAMGGSVLHALNIVCFPEGEDLNILGEILRGGSEKVQEAGGVLCGGHSIQDETVKYGLSVTGMIHPNFIYHNHGAQVGDILILTKPLGVGILLAANRLQALDETILHNVLSSMAMLNKTACECMKQFEVHACTDVTGFGFLGHLHEMMEGSRKSAKIKINDIPIFEEAITCAQEFYITAAGQRNRNFLKDKVYFENVSFAMEEVLYDPQTSGGLLISVARKDAQEFIRMLQDKQLVCGIVGEVIEQKEYEIYVK